MHDDPLDIDAMHVIVGDLQSGSMIKDAWLEDREDQIGYLVDRLLEHVAGLAPGERIPHATSGDASHLKSQLRSLEPT